MASVYLLLGTKSFREDHSLGGVYTADSWRWSSMESAYRGTNEYVMQVGMWRASPKIHFQKPSRVNVHKFMVMAIQEPPQGVAANCQFIYFSRGGDIGAHVTKSKSVSCVAAYTACAVAAGSELFVHYGDAKKRDYQAGFPARTLYKKDIEHREYLCNYSLGIAPHEGWRPCEPERKCARQRSV